MSTSIRVTVCQLENDRARFPADWAALCAHVQAERPDLVLLPEMPFSPWFPAAQPPDARARAQIWAQAVAEHNAWIARLGELGASVVLGSRPALVAGRPVNQGFIWTQDDGYRPAHEKVYLPEEPGYWEASWYEAGADGFRAVEALPGDEPIRVGFAICSELWFFNAARAYMEQGCELLVTPRCTGLPSVEKWLVGGQAAAVVSGAYALSSNRVGVQGETLFGGQGWIVDPDGAILGTTSTDQPFLTLTLDLTRARAAKHTYPRYIRA
ncbi:MAG: carbon-nitrogen hydrolase family protein [Anaerolinea sp.]|nr:carbon-nitrogen hydrolase family protein [Anaerolinea sp.]